MTRSNADARRYERYQRVLGVLVAHEEIRLGVVREACPDEEPALVGYVVRALADDGWLQREETDGDTVYRWQAGRGEFSPDVWIDSKINTARLTRAPLTDRPRERLLALGAGELRTAELLAILVRSGRAGESALQVGEKIAAQYAGGLERLPDAGRGELRALSAVIADTAYCQIMAGIELGLRVAEARQRARPPATIRDSGEAINFCRTRFAALADRAAQEEFHIITVNTKNQVINTHRITVGLLDQCVVHPREVFRPAIKDAAKSIFLVHNHPSGDATPSDKDRQLTQRLQEAGDLLGIQVLDHLIVAHQGTVSLREQS